MATWEESPKMQNLGPADLCVCMRCMGAGVGARDGSILEAATPLLLQVDLTTASLRPGRDSAWLRALTLRVMANVAASEARITVHSSSWLHDLDQVQLPPTPALRRAAETVAGYSSGCACIQQSTQKCCGCPPPSPEVGGGDNRGLLMLCHAQCRQYCSAPHLVDSWGSAICNTSCMADILQTSFIGTLYMMGTADLAYPAEPCTWEGQGKPWFENEDSTCRQSCSQRTRCY